VTSAHAAPPDVGRAALAAAPGGMVRSSPAGGTAVNPAGARAPAPVFSTAFARAYVLTMRPYLCFVSGAAGLVGLALAPALTPRALGVAVAALFASYGLGQALTDVFQTDTDALSAPYRPLTQGAIRRGDVLLVSLAGLGLCGLALGLLNAWTLPLSALGVAGLASYSFAKRFWWAGPPWNAAVVALLPAIGYLCGGAPPAALVTSGDVVPAAASAFFGYAVFVLLGYLKDVSADRATGYRTLPVVAGPRTAIAVSALCALAGLAASVTLLGRLFVAWRPADPRFLAASALWLAGAAALVGAHPLALRCSGEREAHRAIAWTVRGFVWLHTAEAAFARPALALPGTLFCGLAEWALRARPERSQI
jgi:4-hydroxybenzoate polyprenyltransferase